MTLVSENIRYLRKLNGLTQEQFSRKINIKRSLLGAYEEGRANPNQQNIQSIARAFNTTVELLTRQDLRKIRETPSLSIPLGQGHHGTDAPTRTSTIRSDGKIDSSDDDPFQHPDFPDIFAPDPIAQPEPKTPEPQPLASVLNKYYKQEEPRPVRDTRPVPPVITSPVRPIGERATPATSTDHLFEPTPERVAPPLMNEPVRRTPEPQPAGRPYESSPRPSTAAPAATVSGNRVQVTGTPGFPVAGIPVVMQDSFGEYAQRHQQAEYVNRLPVMVLPTLPDGHYRAFEAGDDFTFPGALLVGELIRNWFDIADGKTYVLLVQGVGICCRRVYSQIKVKGTLLLTADRAHIPNLDVPLKDVLEVWDVRAFISQQLPPALPNTERLRQLVDELRFEVERI